MAREWEGRSGRELVTDGCASVKVGRRGGGMKHEGGGRKRGEERRGDDMRTTDKTGKRGKSRERYGQGM